LTCGKIFAKNEESTEEESMRHQGLGGQLIQRPIGPANENRTKGKVLCRSRLGGMLNFYHRQAA
jgi:hypothetical protein